MPKTTYEGYIGRTTLDTDLRPIPRPPEPSRPNVIYIVLDDMGFSHLGCYGSSIATPNIDKLASRGLRYNNFHTTAICSATRASLLTGANHHAVGVNALVESFTVPGSPNSIGHIDNHYGTTAEILKEHGYATFAVGKWHLADMAARTQSGPFDQWPLARGFDKYYGFLHGKMDQFHPDLVRDNTPVSQPKASQDGYHVSEDFTDNAIDYIGSHVNAYPQQPFFLYLAYGAMHSPHHAPQEYSDQYKGQFDAGWDVIRQQWYENQKRLGVIPEGAELTPRNAFAQEWESLPPDEKKLYARYMEVFAGFLTHTDAQIGRVIDFLEKFDVLDNTLIVFLSDNGASAEGGQSGRFNENFRNILAAEEGDVRVGLENIELIGTEHAHNHYPLGWANAGNTPFPWYKAFVHSGGVKDPLIVHYPAAITDPGAVRGQYHHVSDITPTVLDVIGLSKPESIKGIPQKPFTGVSFKYTFAEPEAKTRKRVQYYEILGNRGIWKDGWKAIANHTFHTAFEDDTWELYHTDEDYSEARDVAAEHPDKLRELQDEWLVEAGKNNVFPLIPAGSHLVPNHVPFGIHKFPEERKTFRFITKPFSVPFAVALFLGTYTITAEIDRRGEGVIIAAGNRHGGFSLYIKGDTLKYTYATGLREWYELTVAESLPQGKSTIKIEFLHNGTAAGRARLFLNGKPQGELDIPQVVSILISGNTTIGGNMFTAVARDYDAPFTFEGEVTALTIHAASYAVHTEDELQRFFLQD